MTDANLPIRRMLPWDRGEWNSRLLSAAAGYDGLAYTQTKVEPGWSLAIQKKSPVGNRRPGGHTMVGLKVSLLTQPHHPQQCSDGTSARGQNGSHQQHLHVSPDTSGKNWRESGNQSKIVCGQDRHWSSTWSRDAIAYPVLLSTSKWIKSS
jgi:hypothetical protein